MASILSHIELPDSQWLFKFPVYLEDNPHLTASNKLDIWNDYLDHQFTASEREKYFESDLATYQWLKTQLGTGVTSYSQDSFDAIYYLKHNPDVQEWASQFPSATAAAWTHFRQYGQFERRMYRFDDDPQDDFIRAFPQVAENPLTLSVEQMTNLANTMVVPANQEHPNSMIPAGYIFLGQLIAHDLTFNLTHNMSDPASMTNKRTPQLDLDCLYTNDPASSVYMFNHDGRMMLFNQDKNDLLRNPEGVAIIGDPRNDENLIVSQLQVLMIKFHNKVAYDHPTWNFQQIRQYVVKCYQSVVVHDFLKRLCGVQYIDDWLAQRKHLMGKAQIPIEFAVAGFRFGHAGLPDQLKLNYYHYSVVSLFSLFTDRDSQIDWRMWFGLDAQASKLLEPALASSLANMPISKPDDVPVNHLALRNLMRGQQFKLPSGQQLAQHLNLPIIPANQMNELDDLVPGLSQHTPLWYYLLKEAQVFNQGQQLGPLGAYLVTGVLIDLLYYDSNSILHDATWSYPIKDMEQLINYGAGVNFPTSTS